MLQTYLLEKKEAHYRMAYSYTRNKEDALDVLQDSIEKALRSLQKNGSPNHLNSWFYRILINTAIDYTRKKKRSAIMDPDEFEYLLQSEDHYKNFDLETALEKLPPDYKVIIVLRYFEEMKLQEIAEILGENVNTVKTRLYRGLKFLRIELKENDHESTEGS